MRPSRVFSNRSLFTSFILLVAISFTGCSTRGDLYLRDELAGRGPLGLSGKNPYLAPNLFVANEMKHSDVFRGFIRYRGTPDAVEVRQTYFKPLRVYLFYLADGEAFLMERGKSDWLVRGPEKIPTGLMSSFLNMQAPGPNAPLALDGGSGAALSEAAVAQSADEPTESVKSLRKVPTRAEVTGKPPPTAKKPPSKSAIRKSEPPPPTDSELSSTVKESTSGDLIHRVSFTGETLRLIAKWYTGDINNTGRIARINGIENPDLLTVDMTVRIPRYLLKTTQPLPEAEVTNFGTHSGS